MLIQERSNPLVSICYRFVVKSEIDVEDMIPFTPRDKLKRHVVFLERCRHESRLLEWNICIRLSVKQNCGRVIRRNVPQRFIVLKPRQVRFAMT